jgi:GntR family transcriptional regulator/MocR family aminotransferase
MTIGSATKEVGLEIDRSRSTSITGQIAATLRSAIQEGRLQPGARLPSWRDMAAQLGVARGTVRAAYEALADELLVISAGASGTRVADQAPTTATPEAKIPRPLDGVLRGFSLKPLPFQMGVPAQDAFPAKLWSRLRTRAAREDAMGPVGQPDPRGDAQLRARIAGMLAITRSMSCTPDQIILTGGYRNGLCLTMLVLEAVGKQVWYEDPGFPLARSGLLAAGVEVVPVPVDEQGIRVDLGVAAAPRARLAIVSPAAQAPIGVSLSSARRRDLLAWAQREGAWIVEDDYLGGLQLSRRAAPALAAEDKAGRVIHIGTFNKTLSPALGLGFIVAPVALAGRFAEVASFLNPAPNTTTQLALADLLAGGHFLRHLRQTKQLYLGRREALSAKLRQKLEISNAAPLALVVRLPPEVDDVALARRGVDRGIAPLPLSIWYHDRSMARPGLLLSVTNVHERNLNAASEALFDLVAEG